MLMLGTPARVSHIGIGRALAFVRRAPTTEPALPLSHPAARGVAGPASVLGTQVAPPVEPAAGPSRSILKREYLASIDACAAVNDCPFCQAVIDARPPSFTTWINYAAWSAGLLDNAPFVEI
jgi:hypothetical protein